MHEISIAQDIVEIVEQEMVRHGAKELEAINVAACHSSVWITPLCFSLITAGTNLTGVSLNIREVPLGYMCGSCGEGFTSEEVSFVCPMCGEKNPDLVTGRELNIESIEVAD